MKNQSKIVPEARSEGLLIEKLADEVLVYDLDRHKAHCLNRTAALVWDCCDGKSTVAQMAARVEDETNLPVGQDLVWLALDQLSKTGLLVEPLYRQKASSGISRRQVVRRIGLTAAVALPLITSILAPRAVDAVTCVHTGGACTTSAQCCNGCTCVSNVCSGTC